MRTIGSLIKKYKLSSELLDMKRNAIEFDKTKEVCDEDKWLIVNFLKYNKIIHQKTLDSGYGTSDETIYNNYCQDVLSEEMSKIKPIPEEYLEIGFYKLCHYFPIKNKRLRAIAVLSIHKEYHKGYSDRILKQWIDKERVIYVGLDNK